MMIHEGSAFMDLDLAYVNSLSNQSPTYFCLGLSFQPATYDLSDYAYKILVLIAYP